MVSFKTRFRNHVCAQARAVMIGCLLALSGTGVAQAQSGAIHRAGHEAPLRVASLETAEVKQAVARSSAMTGQSGRIWCVPFAREVSGINLSGNAKTWWGKAENVYPRGRQPVVGSVLNFRATGKMPLGHVAVVSKVVSPRRILVDHANWSRNRVSLDMAVIDVSEANDWTAVRVETLPNTPGSVYPTYGFIYRAAANG